MKRWLNEHAGDDGGMTLLPLAGRPGLAVPQHERSTDKLR